jgi:hypothetical protein
MFLQLVLKLTWCEVAQETFQGSSFLGIKEKLIETDKKSKIVKNGIS